MRRRYVACPNCICERRTGHPASITDVGAEAASAKFHCNFSRPSGLGRGPLAMLLPALERQRRGEASMTRYADAADRLFDASRAIPIPFDRLSLWVRAVMRDCANGAVSGTAGAAVCCLGQASGIPDRHGCRTACLRSPEARRVAEKLNDRGRFASASAQVADWLQESREWSSRSAIYDRLSRDDV